LINRAYRVEDFFVSGDRTHDEDIRKRLATPNACFLVIDDADSSTVGMLAGSVYVEIRGERGYFGLLSVDPDRQKRGLGRALVSAVEEYCRAAGCRFLDLDLVNLREELPAFYAGLGFAPVGKAAFPTTQRLLRDAHLVLMSKPL
jgi:GNAT superfamily N-acetyltransferase